jgi:hypothetical protein
VTRKSCDVPWLEISTKKPPDRIVIESVDGIEICDDLGREGQFTPSVATPPAGTAAARAVSVELGMTVPGRAIGAAVAPSEDAEAAPATAGRYETRRATTTVHSSAPVATEFSHTVARPSVSLCVKPRCTAGGAPIRDPAIDDLLRSEEGGKSWPRQLHAGLGQGDQPR